MHLRAKSLLSFEDCFFELIMNLSGGVQVICLMLRLQLVLLTEWVLVFVSLEESFAERNVVFDKGSSIFDRYLNGYLRHLAAMACVSCLI